MTFLKANPPTDLKNGVAEDQEEAAEVCQDQVKAGADPLDPASQQYMLGVWEKIKNAWGLPGMSKYSKTLETVVTIRIRKDGRIVDINIEKRSGNRVYDESILRVLRSVDPLPPIPSSLNTDSLEIGFRFLPGDLS